MLPRDTSVTFSVTCSVTCSVTYITTQVTLEGCGNLYCHLYISVLVLPHGLLAMAGYWYWWRVIQTPGVYVEPTAFAMSLFTFGRFCIFITHYA